MQYKMDYRRRRTGT